MKKYNMLPVGKRTRQAMVDMYQEMHQEIKKKWREQQCTTLNRNAINNVVLVDKSEDVIVFEGERQGGERIQRKRRGRPRTNLNRSNCRNATDDVVLVDDEDEDDIVFEGERLEGEGDSEEREYVIIGDEDDDEVLLEEKKEEVKVEIEKKERSDDDDGEDDEDDEETEEEQEDEEEEQQDNDDDNDNDDDDDDDYDIGGLEIGSEVSETSSSDSFPDDVNDDEEEVSSEGSLGEDDAILNDDDKHKIFVEENNDEDLPTGSSTLKIVSKERNEKNRGSEGNGNNEVPRGGKRDGNDEEVVGESRKKKIGRRALEDIEVENILAASILEKGEGSLPCREVPEPPAETRLPLKFFFGEGKPHLPPEKSEMEKEHDKLWSEMELALTQNNVNETEMDESDPDTASELDIATRCSRGDHCLILDEEIGTLCKYCSYVDMEIRYCLPHMSKNPFARSERRDYARMPNNASDDIDIQDLEFESQLGAESTVDFKGRVWSIIPGIRRGMHPHQIDGFEFLWKKIAGGIRLEDLKGHTNSSQGSGCVISHAPGTGKSRLTIAFLQTYVKLYPSCKPVIIAPCSMLRTWEAEFQKWKVEVPFHNLNNLRLTGKENKAALGLLKPGNHSAKSIRLTKLYSWKQDSSVLAISYRLFEELAGGDQKRKGSRCRDGDDYDKNVWKALLDLPGLLILDEGHTPRNSKSRIWKALSRTHTGKKIILSGTPFQNNFEELFNILRLVRPEFADRLLSNCCNGPRHRQKSDARDYWASLTKTIGKSVDDRLQSEKVDQVRKMIAPFVHVHKGNILQESLPGLRDSVVILEPAGMQRTLLDMIGAKLTHQNFEMEHAVSVVCVHPYLLCTKSHTAAGIDFDRRKLESLKLVPDAGVKTKFLMELIQLSDMVKEKVLVFSQFIEPLNMISKQLGDRFSWSVGREILLMHGRCDQDQRQASLTDFNDPQSSSKVMLASTKACCEGISMVGASRVVLLDVVWNPSVERQAISRAYRLGQEKVVYIYHLLASGTMEEEKFRRQVVKDRLSELVFYSADESDGSKKLSSTLSDDKKDRLLEQMVEGDKLKHIFKNIIFQPKECNLVETFS